ncbi:MAG TPA: Rne/Rng family ribonuclease [bacterium]|nr:Rne/Rng family ribonuclease [bacterium]HNS49223.1 Rne/Rng family ribonuclease [bacterium]
MSRIVMDSAGFETRAAVLSNGRLEYIEIERLNRIGLVGNVYKAQVVRVLQGLNAAFLNIGESREAFLPLTDLHEDSLYGEEEDDEAAPEKKEPERDKRRAPSRRLRLRPRDQVLIQVIKDSIGTKAPKVTANHISLPGYYLVLLPQKPRRGISRRINNQAERDRLLAAVSEVIPAECGFIIRTSAEGCGERHIKAEADSLWKTWQEITGRGQSMSAPVRLYSELELPLRMLRDRYTKEIEQVMVDSPLLLKSCRQYLGRLGMDGRRVSLHQGRKPLFIEHKVDEEIHKMVARKVPLEGGGYLVIDETEALCAIDVNSGRTGGDDYRSMVLRTNLKAAEEIAWQLRLRNVGGLIVVDFIDMDRHQDRRRVYQSFEKALEPDKARIKVLQISRLGLVEMTRQRTRTTLRDYLAEDCPVCGGQGQVSSAETVAAQLRRDLAPELKNQPGIPLLRRFTRRRIEVKISRSLDDYFKSNLQLVFPERNYRQMLNLVVDPALPFNGYRIEGR